MKWTEKEIDLTINLIKEGKNYNEISLITGREANAIRIKLGRLKEGVIKHRLHEVKKCLECHNDIKSSGVKFCSNSCSAIFNNKLRVKKIKPKRIRKNRPPKFKNVICENCRQNKETNGKIFCSQKCSHEHKQTIIFNKIESGDTTLYHRQYKKYLIDKYGLKCMECGWCEVNKYSGKIPVELEHIDGNSENNSLDNLKLLCPNHHSLTPTYKSLNIGKGRHNRKERYKQGKSY